MNATILGKDRKHLSRSRILSRTAGVVSLALVLLALAGCDPCSPCKENEQRCAGRVVEVCDSGCFTAQTDCSKSGGWCSRDAVEAGVAYCVDALCTKDETRCYAKENFTGLRLLQICGDSGNWELVEDCSKTGKYCEPVSPTWEPVCVNRPPCLTDDTRCNGEVVEICREDTWLAQSNCEDSSKHCEIDTLDIASCI